MNNDLRNFTLIAAMLLLAILGAGCSTLTTSLATELKMGHLKGTQDALYHALSNCPDDTAFGDVKFWTVIGIAETRRIGAKFQEGSLEYVQAVILVNQLGLVLHSRDAQTKCAHIQTAYLETSAFITRLAARPDLLAMNYD